MQKTLFHILVIDDDTRLRGLLGRFLTENSFLVSLAKDALEARDLMKDHEFDLLIVDVMMPKESGISFTKQVRQSSMIPIIILTARGEPDERIVGLESGADDYLQKPFEPKELLLRINNILKRIDKMQPGESKNELRNFGDFSFSLTESRLKKGGEYVYLTEGEAKILKILCESQGFSVSREALLKVLNGSDDRSIDVAITRLRRKIEINPKQPQFLQTVRNLGYILHR